MPGDTAFTEPVVATKIRKNYINNFINCQKSLLTTTWSYSANNRLFNSMLNKAAT